jgi:hypothetical protein
MPINHHSHLFITHEIPPPSPPPIHIPMTKRTRPMPRAPKIRHNPIHTNPILIPTVPRHIRPVPLERHRHLPQVLGHVVERLVELAHGHGVHVVDAVYVDGGGVGEGGGLLGEVRGCAWGGVVLGHVLWGFKGGVGEVWGEGEGLRG